MPLVECKAGYALTHVSGTGYSFERDKYERFVALVENPDHLKCLLAVEHYREVPEVPEEEPEPEGPSLLSADLSAGDGAAAGDVIAEPVKAKRGRKPKAGGEPPSETNTADVVGDGEALTADLSAGDGAEAADADIDQSASADEEA